MSVTATFLAKFTKKIPHARVPPPPFSYMSVFVPIPIKTVTDAFTRMPKNSAPNKDGWVWETLIATVSRAKTAEHLRKFVELFVICKLPKPPWKILSTTIMTPYHNLAQMERDLLIKKPKLRPITT